MKFTIENGVLTIFLEGKIYLQNVRDLKKDVEKILTAHPGKKTVYDASELSYISSAGLRMLMVLQKEASSPITICGVSPDVYEIFYMTGFTQIMNIQKKIREISLEGAVPIGRGRSSTAYRIDSETIVKLYVDGVSMEKIKQELDFSKKAFIAGIPTAISYDVVHCGNSYGVVFEEISNADTVGGTITANPDKFDAVMEKFVDLYKKIHSTVIKDLGQFPSTKDIWQGWVKGMEPYYTSAETGFLRKMIESIPERPTMVHSDYHENNVLCQNGEMVLIDMADVGYGHPIFDLAGGAFRAHCSDMPERKASHGLTPENMHRFWDAVVRLYFSPKSTAQCQEIKEMCEAFGFLRSALFPMKHAQISAELRNLHIADARKNLFPRQEWALAQINKLDEYFPTTVKEKV